MTGRGFKEARRRYRKVFWPIMALYVALVLGVAYWDDGSQPRALLVIASVLTTLPVIGFLYVIWRYMWETDEYTRAKHMEAMTLAGMMCASICIFVGFMEFFDVIQPVETFWFGPLFIGGWGIIRALRSGGDC